MTESFVTQCPHCQTRFRVSRVQLGMARGAVRCGACMQVFNAAEHLAESTRKAAAPAPGNLSPTPAQPEHGDALQAAVKAADVRTSLGSALGASSSAAAGMAAKPPATQTAAPAAAPVTPPKPAEPHQPASQPQASAAKPTAPSPALDDTLWIHDDLDLDNLDLDLDDELDKLGTDDLAPSHARRNQQPPHSPFGSPDKQRDPPDESWAEALLGEPAAAPKATAAQPAAPAATRVIDEPPLEEESRDEAFPELDDDAEDAPSHEQTLVAKRNEPISVGAAAASLTATDSSSARHGEPRLRDEGLRSLADEPLQLDWQAPRTNWARHLLWLLLILLALAGLAGQYVYYRFDELARQDRLRPWLEQACAQIGCSLPPRVDVNLVKSSNLTVRNHPTHPGALTVDAIIYNRADFAQPFPLLELRFEDINGKPLASRSFKPSEYLAGELAGRRDMPPQTPIHIALEIIDPGTQAVNYSIGFHSPD